MARRSFYARNDVTSVIDGIAVRLMGDEGITAEYPDDSSSLTVGVNDAVTSFNSNKTAVLTFNLFPTSPTNDQLYTLYDNARNGAAREFNVIIYSGVNEKISCIGCSISKMGTIATGGPEQQSRNYTIQVRLYNNDPQP